MLQSPYIQALPKLCAHTHTYAQGATHGSHAYAEGRPSLIQERRLEHAEIHCARMKKERDAAGEALQQAKGDLEAESMQLMYKCEEKDQK